MLRGCVRVCVCMSVPTPFQAVAPCTLMSPPLCTVYQPSGHLEWSQWLFSNTTGTRTSTHKRTQRSSTETPGFPCGYSSCWSSSWLQSSIQLFQWPPVGDLYTVYIDFFCGGLSMFQKLVHFCEAKTKNI